MSSFSTTSVHTDPGPTPVGRFLGLAVGIAIAVAVVVLAFSWPGVTAEPRDLPVAVTGPAPAVEGLRGTFDDHQPGVLELVEVDARDDAIDAIESREVYGAIVLGAAPEVLTSSAASPATNQMLTGVAAQLQAALAAQAEAAGGTAAAAAPTVAVTDVVPLSADDPRGTGLTSAMFPMLLGGLVGGVAIALTVRGAARRVAAIVVYAALGGAGLTAILHTWFGSLQGDWWTTAGAIALALAAVAAPIVGLHSVLGRAGIGIGAVFMVLVANPISGVAMPSEFLAWRWGEIGQWMPPGASGTLLRELSYFPAASMSPAWTALGVWAAAGVLLTLVGPSGRARRAPTDDRVAPGQPAEPAAERAVR